MEYPGAICHAVNRADRREDIFKDDLDRKAGSKRPGASCGRNSGGVGGMERRGIGADAQRGPGGSEAGATVAPGNDDEFEVDSAASADGQLDLRFQPFA